MAASGDAPSSEEPAQEAAAARAADGAQDMMFDELLESMMLGDDGSLSLEKNLSSLDTRTSLETTALAATGEPGWLPIATTAESGAEALQQPLWQQQQQQHRHHQQQRWEPRQHASPSAPTAIGAGSTPPRQGPPSPASSLPSSAGGAFQMTPQGDPAFAPPESPDTLLGSAGRHSSRSSLGRDMSSEGSLARFDSQALTSPLSRPKKVRTSSQTREAQQRYRDKQRNRLRDAEAKAQEATAALEDMRREKGEITARAVTLEQFLHRGSTEGQQQAPGASLLPLHSMHSGRTDPLPRQGEQTGTAASRPQPQLQQGPDPVPGRLPLPPTKDRDVWWMDEMTLAEMAAELDLAAVEVFTIQQGRPLRLSHADVARMSLEQLLGMLSQYVQALATCLMEMQGDAQHPAGTRVARLIYELQELWGAVMMGTPGRITLVRDGLAALHGPALDAPVHSKQQLTGETVAALHLDAEQEAAICALRDGYLANMGILRHRLEMQAARLKEAAHQWRNAGVVNEATLHTDFAGVLECMEALRGTMQAEQRAAATLLLVWFRRILSPLQASILMVQTYPAMPCPLSFAEEVAVRAGMPPNAASLAYAGTQGIAHGGGQLVSLMQTLAPRFRSWQRPPVEGAPRDAQLAAASMGHQ